MSRDDDGYWRKVGWCAHALGLPFTATDHEVLAHEQKQRAKAQDLLEGATWFEIFCAELRKGLKPTVPDYCEQGDGKWEDHPPDAFAAAQKAATIFIVEK